MKKLILLALSFIYSVSFANEIVGSNFEARHQKAIIEAIEKQCASGDEYIEISSTQKRISVDQGITDIYFTTEILKKYYIENRKVEETKVKVDSMLSDSYDHLDSTWGSYLILNITCQ